jgi:3-phosphoglycerate kinase
MTNPNFADEQEAPLDPAFEKVRRKMVRLLIVSASVIVLGLMAVVFSIVYRVNRIPQPATPVATTSVTPEVTPAARQSIALPMDFVVESTAMSGNRVLLFGTGADGKKRIVVHDIGTGKTVTEIDLK